MSAQQTPLPFGWEAQWDETHQRHLFIESATGQSQWEHPADTQTQGATPADNFNSEPLQTAQGGHSKRRQYAAGQTQAYYGAPEEAAYGATNPAYTQPYTEPALGGQLFTPGLTVENQAPFTQQQQGVYFQGGDPGYGVAPVTPGFTTQPPVNAGPGQTYPGPSAVNPATLSEKFSQMGISSQKPPGLHTTNLITSPPDPRDLSLPPPEIRLPPGAALSPSPTANADPSYMRSTVNAIPATSNLLGKSKVPLALIITPYRSVKEGEEPVPVVTDTVIARCRRCRTYINPFVQFVDGGARWKCCMCGIVNEVPQMFDWDQINNRPGDRWSRAELNHGVVEYVAPTEYMVRAPQPPVYLFLIDVSHHAVQSGMVATATRTLLESLDRLPNDDGRTKVGFVGFDASLYFFSLPPGSTEATMLVVGDIDDPFLPKPTDLLVNLTESRAAIESLLTRLNDMFQESHSVGSALGSALQAGYKLVSPIGGKIITLSASLPTVGIGALKDREDTKLLGTSKESNLLQPAAVWYKTFAIDCSRSQISVDMFLFSSTYTDVATLSCLPHYTSGQTYFYPSFNAARSEDAIKFAHEFGEVLGSPVGLEAVMRVRASRGLRMAQFHGNFFVRSTDLLAMPAVPVDQSYAIEVQIEENLNAPFVVFQCAVLHTSCYGERRIRVITLALPTTNNMSEIFTSADQVALATLLANKAVERSMSAKLEDARDAVTNKMVDILVTYKSTMTAAGSGASAQLAVCDNLKLLPLLLLGLTKNVGLRHSTQIPSDLRSYAQALLTTLPSQLLIPYIHPMFYSLHNMANEAGTIGEHGIIMPEPIPLTSERLERHGLYLIEDGQAMFLWVGRDAVPQLIKDVFDLPSYTELRAGKTTLPILENDFSPRLNAIISKTREMRRGPYYAQLYVAKEDGEPPMRLWALSHLIQDRGEQSPSYMQYLSTLKERVNYS